SYNANAPIYFALQQRHKPEFACNQRISPARTVQADFSFVAKLETNSISCRKMPVAKMKQIGGASETLGDRALKLLQCEAKFPRETRMTSSSHSPSWAFPP